MCHQQNHHTKEDVQRFEARNSFPSISNATPAFCDHDCEEALDHPCNTKSLKKKSIFINI